MIKDSIKAIRAMFAKRQYAYRMVFDKNNKYTSTVLMDLAKFCRASESTFHEDARAHAVLEGRREVWLRVQEYLQLTPDEIMEIHRVKELARKEEQRK